MLLIIVMIRMICSGISESAKELFATTMFAQEKKVAFTFDVSFGKSTSYNTVGGLNVESSHITSFPNCLNYKMI